MPIKPLFILLFLLSFSGLNAQEFKLGKVSVAELEQKEHPKDPAAAAAILYKTGEVRIEYSDNDGFTILTDVKMRIKIYKKEGYDWASNVVSYFYFGDIKENVIYSDAATYNLVNGKIEKTKLKSDGEFNEKINRYLNRKKITLPNVKEGSVLEFEYTIKSNNIGNIRQWDFQTSIPINFCEYKTYIPEYYQYNPRQKGSIFPKVTVEKNQKAITFTDKQRTNEGGGFGGIKTTFSYDKVEYQETKTTYTAENVPALKEEAFVNNIDNYTSSITHELSMVKYPNSMPKMYSTDWGSVVKTIYKNEDFGPELNKTGYFEEDINTLMKGLSTQEEKIATIFEYVKSKVKWNGMYGYSCDDGVKKAYKDKTGNVAEINLMLTAMLRYVGVEANPVLVSTRSNGIAFFPNRTAYNYVIAGVEIQNGLILLDATAKFSMPNTLPLRDLNWFGRLIRKEGSSTEVDLMPKSMSRIATNISGVLSADGTTTGKIRTQYTDHEALRFREKNLSTSKETYQEELEKTNNNIEISDYVRDNELDLSNPVSETYSFKDNKDSEIINGKIYFSPLLFLATKENPFKQEVREYPVDFGYPTENKYNINIEIPEGYAVESLPQAINIATGENVGSFKYVIATNENKIQVSITSDINVAIVPADFYDVLKDFYKQMIDKLNEKIVLVKK